MGGQLAKSRPKMTNISLFSIETQVPLNDFSSAIFKNLDVDNQMSQSCGQDEPLSWPKNAFFSCVIGIYFVAFFIDHPVYINRAMNLNCHLGEGLNFKGVLKG